jgi:beta-glucosidase
VRVKVRNTGRRTGKVVVQLYVQPIDPPVARPLKELRAFAKVELAPGGEAEVRLELTRRDYAYFDAAAGQWVASPGSYALLAGQHAESLIAAIIAIS